MDKMTHRERIQAALAKKEVDRVPINIWWHMPDIDQDPVNLAETQIQLAEEYDFDFIKMMPFGNYEASDFGLSCTYYCDKIRPVFERKWGIQCLDDYKRVTEKPGDFGNHGKHLLFTQEMQRMLAAKKSDLPYVQTIFSPLTNLKKLAGPQLFTDMREHPEVIKPALEAFAATTADYAKKCIEAGVSGFFFASQCSTYDLVTEEEYKEFGVPYDMKVLDAFKDTTWFNIVHIHGPNTMWKLMADYPVNCVNWHDRWVAPDMAEARKLTDKCLMGGINEKQLSEMTVEEIRTHLKEAVECAGTNRGLILSPGCVAHTNTPALQFMAARVAAENL